MSGQTKPMRIKNQSALMVFLKARTFIALIILLVVFIVLEPKFMEFETLKSITKHVARYAILGIGMTFVIISGGIDLSVGSVAGLAGMISGGLIAQGIVMQTQVVFFNTWVVVLIALGVGLAVGLANGFLVSFLKIPAFIATLGTMYIARGAAMLTNSGQTFPNLVGKAEWGNTGFPFLGAGEFLGIPIIIWFMIGIAILTIFILKKTPLGWHIFATGGNENAAKLSGIKVRSTKMFVYALSGVCAAITGVFAASELVAAHPATGESWEMNAIAASVLGGTSMAGGIGGVGGTIVGAFVIGVLTDGMIMLGISSFWQMIIKGAVIIVAVVIDQSQSELQKKVALQQREA